LDSEAQAEQQMPSGNGIHCACAQHLPRDLQLGAPAAITQPSVWHTHHWLRNVAVARRASQERPQAQLVVTRYSESGVVLANLLVYGPSHAQTRMSGHQPKPHPFGCEGSRTVAPEHPLFIPAMPDQNVGKGGDHANPAEDVNHWRDD